MAFIEATYEQQIAQLAEFAKTVAPSFAASAKAADTLSSLVELIPALLAHSDSESALNSIVHLSVKSDGAVQKSNVAKLTSTLAAASSTDFAQQRLNLLVKVFNSLSATSPLRYTVFLGILSLAPLTSAVPSIVQQLESLPKWCKEWSVSRADQLVLYRAVYALLIKANQSKQACDILAKFLQQYNGASTSDLQSVKQDAVNLLSQALQSRDVFHLDEVLQLGAVEQLKGAPVHAAAHVLAQGDYAAYRAWLAANSTALTELGVTDDILARKVRLQQLAKLCSAESTVSFSKIAEVLQVDAVQVENWVIDVIGSGLVEAKIDQINENVIVTRSTLTAFGPAQWASLKTQLESWQANLAEVSRVIQTVASQTAAE